jgi:microcystin degradation protein MlrC
MVGFITQLGRTAVVEITDFRIVLTLPRAIPLSIERLHRIGSGPARQRRFAVESAIAHCASVGTIARLIEVVGKLWISSSNMDRLISRLLPSPLYPFKEMAACQLGATG